MSLRARLSDAVARAAEVERLLSNPATAKDQKQMAELGREHRQLEKVVAFALDLKRIEGELVDVHELVSSDDVEMAEEARSEEHRLQEEIARLEIDIKPALLPPDPLMTAQPS